MNTTPIGIVVLVAFSLSFALICAWAMWPSNKQQMQKNGLIPLREDHEHDGQ